MTTFLLILGIYIGMVVLSLLGPYIDFRENHCEKGKKYTLEDLREWMDDRYDSYWIICFIPCYNLITVILTLVLATVPRIWKKIKSIRIV